VQIAERKVKKYIDTKQSNKNLYLTSHSICGGVNFYLTDFNFAGIWYWHHIKNRTTNESTSTNICTIFVRGKNY